MSRIFLLRHAKAEPAQKGVEDVDRPLAPSGMADAENMGKIIRARGYQADVVLVSPALRTRQTWERISGQEVSGRDDDRRQGSVVVSDLLYGHAAADYLAVIRNMAPEASSLLLVGHNPMITRTARTLSGNGEAAALGILHSGFPTCGLAIISFEMALPGIAPKAGFLESFLVP